MYPHQPIPFLWQKTTADKRQQYVEDKDGSVHGDIRERFISPELLPPMGTRSKLKDYLERQDCYKRRKAINIPEFYVGKLQTLIIIDMIKNIHQLIAHECL